MKKIIFVMLFVFMLFSSESFAENKKIGNLNCEVINNYKLDVNTYPDNILVKDNFTKELIIYGHNSEEEWEGYVFYNNGELKKYSFNDSDDEYFKKNGKYDYEKIKENYFNKRDKILKDNTFKYSYGNHTKLLNGYYFNDFNYKNVNIKSSFDNRIHIKYLNNIYNIEGKIYNIKNINGKLTFILVKKDGYKINLFSLKCGIDTNNENLNKNIKTKKLKKIKESEKFDYINENLIYNNNNNFAFVGGINGGKHSLIKDFKEIDSIKKDENKQFLKINFSENGKIVSYIYVEDYNNYYNVIDGITYKMSGNVLDIINKSNEKISKLKNKESEFKKSFIKHIYNESTGWETKYYFEKKGYKSELYDNIKAEYIAFSKNNNDFAFWGERDGKYILNKNGKEILFLDKVFNKIYRGKIGEEYIDKYLYMSKDGKHLAYIKLKEGKKVAVLDGYETEKYDEIGKIIILTNGKGLLLEVKKDGKVFVVKYSIDNNYIKNNFLEINIKLKISKNNLIKTKVGKKYLNKLEKFIPRLKTEKLIKVSKKLEKLDFNNTKIKKYKLILEYIKYKILVELENRK